LANANSAGDQKPFIASDGEWSSIIAGPGGTGPADIKGNKGIVQKDGPYKGFFISKSSLYAEGIKDELNPGHWVDATKVPYLALPFAWKKNGKYHPGPFEELGLKLGDYAVAVNSRNAKLSPAIFADTKVKHKLGESSVALADALDIPSNPKHGGTSGGIIYLVFPSSGAGQGTIPSVQEIQSKGITLFEQWGGMDRLIDCFPEWLGICHNAARHKRKKA
jgi:Fungal chitosanase of glycosyl hydrolase group 75